MATRSHSSRPHSRARTPSRSRRPAVPPGWETAYKLGEMALAAPQVIAHRTAQIANAGPTPSRRDTKEFLLMGQEKVAAMSAAMFAMALPLYKMNQELMMVFAREWWNAWMRGASTPATLARQWENAYPEMLRAFTTAATNRKVQTQLVQALEKGLAPIHKRVTDNARRLNSGF